MNTEAQNCEPKDDVRELIGKEVRIKTGYQDLYHTTSSKLLVEVIKVDEYEMVTLICFGEIREVDGVLSREWVAVELPHVDVIGQDND